MFLCFDANVKCHSLTKSAKYVLLPILTMPHLNVYNVMHHLFYGWFDLVIIPLSRDIYDKNVFSLRRLNVIMQ